MMVKKDKHINKRVGKRRFHFIILLMVILFICSAAITAYAWIRSCSEVLSDDDGTLSENYISADDYNMLSKDFVPTEENEVPDAEWQQEEKDEPLSEQVLPDETEIQDNLPKAGAEDAGEDNEEEILHFVDAWGEWHDAVIDPAVPRHSYNWDCLKRNHMDISYKGDTAFSIRKGIDVSHHQGTIDWSKVKAAGYEFAFIRIGYRGYGTTGTVRADREFAANLTNAQAAGLDAGVYFFSQAVNETEALEEAEFVIEQLSGAKLDLPVVYDPELIRDDAARTDNVTGEQFTKNTIAFCEAIRKAGYEPMIYSNMVWEGFLFDMKQLEDYPVWYADYEPIPQTPYQFAFWQYTEKGNVDGVEGIVDLDVQFIKAEK